MDASVLFAALAGDAAGGDRARSLMSGASDIHVPHLVDLEVLSILRRFVRTGAMSEARCLAVVDNLRSLPLRRYPQLPFAARIWQLRDGLSSYDAAYVAVAEAVGCHLVTADRRLAQAQGPTCPIDVLE